MVPTRDMIVPMDSAAPIDFLLPALQARLPLLDEAHHTALRLFNGFYEGIPWLAVDLFGRTLLLHDYRDPPGSPAVLEPVIAQYRQHLGWLACVVWKPRTAADPAVRRGSILWGSRPDRKIRENGVWYALDLTLHRDATLFLDTRLLRSWLQEQSAGLSVLNTFAYTGSLGAAALAGGAIQVIQIDAERTFLNLAKDTYALNGFPVRRADFLSGDFFPISARLRRQRELFDLLILDPPFFSQTARGRVDLLADMGRLINKVRPLVADGGRLVAVNNAVYLSGREYLHDLEAIGSDGYAQIEEIIPVPADFTGFPASIASPPLADPAPFNHSTKIAVLRLKRRS